MKKQEFCFMKNIKTLLAFAVTFLFMTNSVKAYIVINEVMADPDDNCRDCTEWIELCLGNNSSEFVVDAGGKSNNFSINGTGFFVITKNKTAFMHLWKVNGTAVVEGKTSLNNNGDCVVLYDETSIIDSFCYNSSKRNISWIRCETGWVEAENATPGYENVCPVNDGDAGALSIIYWRIVPTNATIGDSVNFSVVIENNRSEPTNVSTFMIIEKLDTEIFCGELELTNGTAIATNCSWIVPANLLTNDEEKFEVYPEINFNGSRKRGEIKIIMLEGMQDFGDPYIVAEDPLESARFGDFALVRANLYTGNNNLPLRIVTYIYKPRWASMDLDGNPIRSHLNNTKTALLLENIKLGENIILYLPLLIKSNCGGEYSAGCYRGRVRAYMDGTDEIVAQDTFNITFAGNNPMFCMECQECEKSQCNCNGYSSACSCSDGKLENETRNEFQDVGEQLIRVVSYEECVPAGNIFKTVVKLENILNVIENFSVYSYVFNGSGCVSLGFDGKSWKNTWTANKKMVELSPGSSLDLTLENMIENETSPGVYKFRVRLKYGNKSKDVTRDVNITSPSKNTSAIIAYHEANFTESPEFLSKGLATGMTIAQDPDILFFFSSIYNNIASWLISIFKF